MTVHILIFAEGDFEQVSQRATRDEAEAYASGAMDGARMYGAGSFTAYVMPDDEAMMERDEQPAAVRKAIAAWRAAGHSAGHNPTEPPASDPADANSSSCAKGDSNPHGVTH